MIPEWPHIWPCAWCGTDIYYFKVDGTAYMFRQAEKEDNGQCCGATTTPLPVAGAGPSGGPSRGSGAAGSPPHRPAPVHSGVWETWLFSGPGAGCREPVLAPRLQGSCHLPLCGAQFSRCIHFPEYLLLVASSAGRCVDWFKSCPQSRAHPNLGSCLDSSVPALFKTQCIFCETSHCSCRLSQRLEMLKILLLLNFESMLEHLQVPLNLVFKKLSNLHLAGDVHLPVLPLSPSELAVHQVFFLAGFAHSSAPPRSSYMQK